MIKLYRKLLIFCLIRLIHHKEITGDNVISYFGSLAVVLFNKAGITPPILQVQPQVNQDKAVPEQRDLCIVRLQILTTNRKSMDGHFHA